MIKLKLWLISLLAKICVKSNLKNKNTIICDICGKEVTKQDIGSCNYDITNMATSYWCKKCNEKHENIQKQIAKDFIEFCPLHKSSCLFCENCKLQEQCKDKVKEIYKKGEQFNYD